MTGADELSCSISRSARLRRDSQRFSTTDVVVGGGWII